MLISSLYTGQHFSEPEIRNCHLTFYSSDFDVHNDLIVLQIYKDWGVELKENVYGAFASKELPKEIKSYVVPPTEISLNFYRNHYKVYTAEIFLDDFNINFEHFDNNTFSYNLDPVIYHIKNYKKTQIYKELKEKLGAICINKLCLEKDLYDSECIFSLTNLYKTEDFNFTKPENFETSEELVESVSSDYFESYKEAAINGFVSSNLRTQTGIYEEEDLKRLKAIEVEKQANFNETSYYELDSEREQREQREQREYEEAYEETIESFQKENEEDEYEIDDYENPIDTYIQKYNLENINELKYFFFLSLGVYLANIDDEFSSSEKKLIKDILSEQIPVTRTNKLIQAVEKRLQDNHLIISEIISEINYSLMHWEVVEIVNNLYALISVDGIASIQEIEFLDKITESLHIDFQYKNEIKTKQLLNVDIEDDKTNFAILDIEFSSPENIQIKQAEEGIIKWNGRLNTLTDPKERTNAQNFINKYSEFIKQKRTAQHTNSERKKSTTPSKSSTKRGLLEPLGFPIPPKSTSEELNKIRKQYPRHRARWSVSEEEMLIKLYRENYTINQIASGLQRSDDAIENKLEKLNINIRNL